jgi:hypothetical protein
LTPPDSYAVRPGSFLGVVTAWLASADALMLEERPDVVARVPADLARKLRLEVRKANLIAPAICIHDHKVSALVIAALDQQPGRVGVPYSP